MRRQIALLLLILAGFALRLLYLTGSHPFFDEYTTVLAARQTLRYGWPVLPSGLFYEHGLLATYLAAPFTALFIDTPPAGWQPGHWGLMLARWPSALAGTLTIPLLFVIGRRFRQPFAPAAALLAAGLFAFSPEGMVWGGRARMYALATLLVLVTVYWAYRGAVYPAPARYRWAALLALLAALLTQLGAIILIPPLLAGMVVAGWLSFRAAGPARRAPWFFRPALIPEGLALAGVIGLALLVKRLGQPLGADPLGTPETGSLPLELLRTVTYQATLHFTWADTLEFLARQFGVPHHLSLALAALLAGLVCLFAWAVGQRRPPSRPAASFNLFLWIVFGLILLQMVTLLEPFRRNPRYLVMVLPLFYLLAAYTLFNLLALPRYIQSSTFPEASSRLRDRVGRPHGNRLIRKAAWSFLEGLTSDSEHTAAARFSPLLALALLAAFVLPGLPDLRLALVTPEPAYEEAFQYILAHRRPGDAVLTMNTPAAELYLGRADGFTVQAEAEQFLLADPAGPVDRWLGVPWLGTAVDFNAVLNAHDRAWFVIDTVRLPVYFRGDWQAVLNSQMEPAWAGDNALVYQTRPGRTPLPARPEVLLATPLGLPGGDTIRLVGYAFQPRPAPSALPLTLFWQPLAAVAADYTVFLHLRDAAGTTVAQYDGQPLAGIYPTSHWQPGETVLDPVSLALPPGLPPGTYSLWAGLYQWQTLARLPVTNDSSGENAIRLGEVTLP